MAAIRWCCGTWRNGACSRLRSGGRSAFVLLLAVAGIRAGGVEGVEDVDHTFAVDEEGTLCLCFPSR